MVETVMTNTQVTAPDLVDEYTDQVSILQDEIDALNTELGLTTHRITFGYIGNCDTRISGEVVNDHRSWKVFLPHPGRVGTYEDCLGGFPTGSLEGVLGVRREFKNFARGARFAKGL